MFLKKKKTYDPRAEKITVSVGGKEKKRVKLKTLKESGFEKTSSEDLSKLNLTRADVKRIKKKEGKVKGGAKDIKFTVYQSNAYGKIANNFFESLTSYLNKNFPQTFKYLSNSLRSADMAIITNTYMSMVILSGFIGFFVVLLFVFIISVILGANIAVTILRSIGLAFLGFIGTLAGVYLYPSLIIGGRKKAIKNDLPFVIVHMSAVAGSGAQPISIFNLVLNTGEYKGLEKEIRKIVNYVNLFGYDLSSALRSVAATTPSPQFRELLTGIVSTLETGGSLKSYLKSKSEEALTDYKLERQKYVESISTYSDIYTSVLIAAPLLFLITIAIINMLGGKIGGFEAKDLAFFSTFIFLPFLNMAFIIFLNMIQPGD
ncbi:MAG: type II secretion system F family protein [Candidatus Woesearchaeota archaeon]